MSSTAQREAYRFIVSTLLTLPLVANLVAQMLGWSVFYLADAKVQLIWGTLVQLLAGWTFYADAIKDLRTGRVGSDLLVALSTTAAYLYSAYQTLAGLRPVYFEVSALLITAVTLGKLLRAVAAGRSRGAA